MVFDAEAPLEGEESKDDTAPTDEELANEEGT